MTSPFPGMDPYLEDPRFWPGFHSLLIGSMVGEISRKLPSGYYADVQQHVWLENEDPEESREVLGSPDTYVSDLGGGTAVATMPRTITRITGSLRLHPQTRKRTRNYLAIIDQAGQRVVTVIELLSPSNKDSGRDRDKYLQKREEYFLTGTNVLEIDLLRAGERVLTGAPVPADSDYVVLLSRAVDYPDCVYWAFSVRDPLPVVLVPLKVSDGELDLDLRACLDATYGNAQYERRLRYSQPPVPPLKPADAEWARQWLAAK